MRRAWGVIRKYGWLLLVAVGATAAAVLLPRWNPWDTVKLEMRVIDAEERARLAEVLGGKDAAIALVEAEHRATIKALDAKQRRRVDELRNDPLRLARALARLAGQQPATGSNPKG